MKNLLKIGRVLGVSPRGIRLMSRLVIRTAALSSGVLLLLDVPTVQAQSAWTTVYQWPLGGDEFISSMATTPTGSVVAVNVIRPIDSITDIVVLHVDRQGTLDWARHVDT